MVQLLRALLALLLVSFLAGCPALLGGGDDDDSATDDDDAADDDDATADDDDATADDDDATGEFLADGAALGGEITVDDDGDPATGGSVVGTTEVIYVIGQTPHCSRFYDHTGDIAVGAVTDCPDCTATWTTGNHLDVTPPSSCDVPPSADVAGGGAVLDQLLTERVLIPWADAPITDTLPAIGASWTQIAAQLAPQYGTPQFLVLGDYTALQVAGDYESTDLARVGVLFNDGTAVDGLSGDYVYFSILGFQF